MAHLQRAAVDDAPGIARVKAAAWPGEESDAAYIARVIPLPDHASQVAEDGRGGVVGFVDGFLTLSQAGALRWEVDLLAVDPACHGQGIGTALVQASTEAGRDSGAALARALIKVGNVPSERAFARCGYGVEGMVRVLYVGRGEAATAERARHGAPLQSASEDDAYLLPVTTFGYRGIWIEGRVTPQSLETARAACARHGWSGGAGTLIPADDARTVSIAEAAGFAPVGEYRWWVRAYP